MKFLFTFFISSFFLSLLLFLSLSLDKYTPTQMDFCRLKNCTVDTLFENEPQILSLEPLFDETGTRERDRKRAKEREREREREREIERGKRKEPQEIFDIH